MTHRDTYEGFMPCCNGCKHAYVDCQQGCISYHECIVMIEEGNVELLEIVNYYNAEADGELPF